MTTPATTTPPGTDVLGALVARRREEEQAARVVGKKPGPGRLAVLRPSRYDSTDK